MSLNNWPFDDPPNVATITLRQIIHEGELIDRVWHHEEDGQWQFLSSRLKFDTKDAMLVSLKSVTDLDPTILELYDLPEGWEASRSAKNQPWQRSQTESEQP